MNPKRNDDLIKSRMKDKYVNVKHFIKNTSEEKLIFLSIFDEDRSFIVQIVSSQNIYRIFIDIH